MGFGIFSLTRSIVFGIACLAADLATGAPFWFLLTVPISFDGGKTMLDKEVNVGLFYMFRGDFNLVSLIFLDKASNSYTTPPMMRVGQIFFALAVFGIFVCFVASMLLLFKKYSSVTGEILLSGASLGIAVSAILGVVFPLLATLPGNEVVWNRLPLPDHFIMVKAMPKVAIDWAFYAAALAAVLALAAAVISWIQACTLCKHFEDVRYQQLHDPSLRVREPEKSYIPYGMNVQPYYDEKEKGFSSVDI